LFVINKGFMPVLIRPFKGLLYSQKGREDIAARVCPPYDVIPDPLLYYDRSPFNAVRLELPAAAGGGDVYEKAKETLDGWLAGGVLAFDDQESIYIYDQEFAVGGRMRRRRGIIPLVRLNGGQILTHEETQKAALEDRKRLIHGLGAITSLIFSMYEGAGEVERLIDAAPKELLYDFRDELSIRNRFYRMSDPSGTAAVSSAMEEKRLYVADGHHRLSVALGLGLPSVPMYLTDMYSDGIAILPYHRAVKLKERKGQAGVLDLLSPCFDISRPEVSAKTDLDRLIEEISSSRALSFLLYFNEEGPKLYKLVQKRAIDFDPDSPPALRRLKVNAVHRGALKHLLGVDDEDISYMNGPDEAAGLVDGHVYDFAVFVPATSVEEVREIADNGLFMPPKSTYFYPKVLTGLVFHKYA
jgi:uncharacterized protein (DUF1015 family)